MRDPASTSAPPRDPDSHAGAIPLWPASRELDELRDRFPGYVIEKNPRLDPPRWTAVARSLAPALYSVTTADLGELIAVLAAAQARIRDLGR